MSDDSKVVIKRERRPTMKEKRFAKEYVKNGGDGTAAALAVYDTSSKVNAAVIANKVLNKPRVQSLVETFAEKYYPDLAQDSADVLRRMLKLAKESDDLKAIAKVVEIANSMQGLNAPKVTESKKLVASVKLPGSE